MVEKVESDIKRGMNFDFPWQKEDGGRTAIKLVSVGDCLEEWLEIKQTNTSSETLRTYTSSLKMFAITLKRGEDTPLRNINTHGRPEHVVSNLLCQENVVVIDKIPECSKIVFRLVKNRKRFPTRREIAAA